MPTLTGASCYTPEMTSASTRLGQMWSFLLVAAMSFGMGALVERYEDITAIAFGTFIIAAWLCVVALVASVLGMSGDEETLVPPCWSCGAMLDEGDEECWKCEADQAVPHE